MINQLKTPFNYSVAQDICVRSASNNWDSKRNCILELKATMHTHFDKFQRERCCYCGLLYDRTGRGEIDHIAPKGDNLYPQFSFTSNNLAKACQLCNSSSMKHTYDSIEILSPVYENCNFKIVHPYLDDHTLHFNWKYGLRRVVISIANNSEKAKESIKLFELASEKRTRARAIERNQEYLDLLFNITDDIKNRIKAVLEFRV